MFRKHETDGEMRKRIFGLAKPVDCGMLPPPMDAQVALHEICDFLLGKDWFVVNPISQEQINTEIVYAIESLYKRKK